MQHPHHKDIVPRFAGIVKYFLKGIFIMTVDEMANQEAKRVETMRVLNYQTDIVVACDAINPILKDLERIAREDGFLWASLYVFSLGKIYGVRQERARKARKAERNVR